MIKIYFDGCAAPSNPGHGGAGWAIQINNEQPITECAYLGSKRTNNEAEYAALYLALHHGIKLGINTDKVHIYGDSKLVVNQVIGRWSINKPHLQHLKNKVDSLLVHYPTYYLEWINRDMNNLADEVSARAILNKGISIRKGRIKKLKQKGLLTT